LECTTDSSFNYVFVPQNNHEIDLGIENVRAVVKMMERMCEDSNASSDKSICVVSVMPFLSVSETSFEGEIGIRN
jgi:hypothetical protein